MSEKRYVFTMNECDKDAIVLALRIMNYTCVIPNVTNTDELKNMILMLERKKPIEQEDAEFNINFCPMCGRELEVLEGE